MGVVTVTAPRSEPLAEKSAVSELALFQGENGPEVDDPQWLPVSQVPVPPTAVPLADQNSRVACTGAPPSIKPSNEIAMRFFFTNLRWLDEIGRSNTRFQDCLARESLGAILTICQQVVVLADISERNDGKKRTWCQTF